MATVRANMSAIRIAVQDIIDTQNVNNAVFILSRVTSGVGSISKRLEEKKRRVTITVEDINADKSEAVTRLEGIEIPSLKED